VFSKTKKRKKNVLWVGLQDGHEIRKIKYVFPALGVFQHRVGKIFKNHNYDLKSRYENLGKSG